MGFSPNSTALPLSLADFFHGESSDPLAPPRGFREWRDETGWAASLYEQEFHGGPTPRTRVVTDGAEAEVINLTSYNYLGLATHPAVVAAAQEALASRGAGACGSPLLAGMTDLHRELERKLAQFLGRESALLFNSGFGGAMGSVAGLLRRGDVALADERAHVSLTDGAQLAHARLEVFFHNDPAALDAALRKHPGRRRLVMIEGIYSMDGDMADLPALCAVARTHGASVMIDEAHSVLTTGAHGRGVSELLGCEDAIGLYYGTFSKAFGGVGGFVSGRAETIDYLRCYARSYGYSCALPPATVAGLLAGLEVAARDGSLRARLRENAAHFREALNGMGLDTGESTTHVVPIIVGADRPLLYTLGIEMRRRGLILSPIDYPAVPADRVRFRASVTAAHTRADLDSALAIIREVLVPALAA